MAAGLGLLCPGDLDEVPLGKGSLCWPLSLQHHSHQGADGPSGARAALPAMMEGKVMLSVFPPGLLDLAMEPALR